MNRQLHSILLVDDDEATNYLHKRVIEETFDVEHIEIATNGQVALDYLKKIAETGALYPQIIFLDINMPVMNGWQFLEEFEKLVIPNKEQLVVMMLTTSVNPLDFEYSKDFTSIHGYRRKPLTHAMLIKLYDEIMQKNNL
jgi:CheY-like chemotaxis protein